MDFLQTRISNKVTLVPYSDTDSSEEIVEEETCVGKRGRRIPKPLPKRLLRKKRPSTLVKPNPCLNKKCGNACADKFSESQRWQINEHFWGMGNKDRQKRWLMSCVTRKSVKRKTSESSRRHFSYEYTLNYDNASSKVCQQFLLKTLNITQKLLRSIRNITLTSPAKKNVPRHNKTPEYKIKLVNAFIQQLPAVPSHYCRNKSNKLYLPEQFRNVSTLYKCYTEHLKSIDKQTEQLSLRMFRKIFHNNFRIGFHKPKIDKCMTCEQYKKVDKKEQENLQQSDEYRSNIKDKERSKQIFFKEQMESKINPSFLCATFDLQKVLSTPHGRNVNLYYSRKYSYYNESVYESGTRNGYCFLWREIDGKRGCNEICTVIFEYLKIIDERKTCKQISLYCDSCAGQNKNKAMLATLAYFLEQSNNIQKIKITYLLPGHTMMPVDSVHSTIEPFIRNRNVWAPSEWYTVIGNARTNPENYNCIIMKYCDFKNWKAFSLAIFPVSSKLSFKTLRSAELEKNNPYIVLRYGYFENSKKVEYCLDNHLRKNYRSLFNKGPAVLYRTLQRISLLKYADLKSLCDKNIIPEIFNSEYLNLKHNSFIKDTLPDTDEEDDNFL